MRECPVKRMEIKDNNERKRTKIHYLGISKIQRRRWWKKKWRMNEWLNK